MNAMLRAFTVLLLVLPSWLWAQDIGFQPFRDANWLLTESKRLLRIPASRNLPAAAQSTAGR